MAMVALRRMVKQIRSGVLVAGLAGLVAGCAEEVRQAPLPMALGRPGTELSRIEAPEPVQALAWSSDGSLLTGQSSSGTQVYVWNSATGLLLWTANRAAMAGVAVPSVAFSPDGLAVVTPAVGIAVTNPDAALSLLSVLNGKVMRTVQVGPGAGSGLGRGVANQASAFALDGDVAAVVLGGTRIGLFDTRGWRLLRTLGPVTNQAGQPLLISGVAMDRRHDRLALSSGGLVQLWTLTDGKRVTEFPAYRMADVTGLAFDPRDGSLVTAGALPPGGPATYRWNPAPDMTRPAPSPAVEEARMLVRHWAPDSRERTMTYAMGYGAPQAVAVSPDGRRVAAASGKTDRTEKGFLMLWDTASGAVIGGLVHDDTAPAVLAFSPEGGRLAYTVGRDVVLMDLTRRPPPPPEAPVTEVPAAAGAGGAPAKEPDALDVMMQAPADPAVPSPGGAAAPANPAKVE